MVTSPDFHLSINITKYILISIEMEQLKTKKNVCIIHPRFETILTTALMNNLWIHRTKLSRFYESRLKFQSILSNLFSGDRKKRAERVFILSFADRDRIRINKNGDLQENIFAIDSPGD